MVSVKRWNVCFIWFDGFIRVVPCWFLSLLVGMEPLAIDAMDSVVVFAKETIEKARLARLTLVSSVGKERWSACGVEMLWFDWRRNGREDSLKMFREKNYVTSWTLKILKQLSKRAQADPRWGEKSTTWCGKSFVHIVVDLTDYSTPFILKDCSG